MRFGLYFFLCLLGLFGAGAQGFVPQMDRNRQGRVVSIRWTEAEARSGIPFWVDAGSFPFPQADVLRVVQEGFNTWANVSTVDIGFTYQGTGDFDVSSSDRRNVVMYDATGLELGAPAGTGVIAVTRVNWNERGEITDADIVFNGRDFQFTTDRDSGRRGVVDLGGVLIHEIGHFAGLDHTPLQGSVSVRPTMYPFSFGEEHTLEMDDEAGISALYPSVAALRTGAISGRVTRHDGTGAFGVHVVAYQAGTQTFAVGVLAGASGTNRGPGGDGAYEISGLPPGAYQVAIEPLTGSVGAENFGGIFRRNLDVDFPREYYDNVAIQSASRVVQVGAGLMVPGIDFAMGTAVPGAPFIQDLVQPTNTPDRSGPYRVEARIADTGGPVTAHLVYRLNGGALRQAAFAPEGGDRFVAEIPGQGAGTMIEYQIRAEDNEGNQTVLPPRELPFFQFKVLSLSGEPVLYVALRRSGVLSIIDTGTGQEVARVPTGDTPLAVVLSPDDRYVFVTNTGSEAQGGQDNRITVVETATHRVAATLEVGAAPLDLVASPDGRFVYVTNSRGRSVSVIDVSALREARRFPVSTVGDGPFGVVVSPDGGRLYVTDIDGAQVLVLDAAGGGTLGRIGVVGSPRSLALSADGRWLYVAGFEGGISVVDTESGTSNRTISTPEVGGIFRLGLSPDEQTLYGTDQFGANLVVFDLIRDSQRVVPALSGGRNTRDLMVSPDGRVVYVTNQDSNDLLFFDTGSLRITRSITLSDGPRGIAVRTRSLDFPVGQEGTPADFDGSGRVDFADFLLFSRVFGTSAPDPSFEARFDLNGNGRVDFADFLLFAGVFGRVFRA